MSPTDAPEEATPGRERIQVRIESLAAGGDGVGHAPDGRVVFVPFTAPGDIALVEITNQRARWLRGRAAELIEAGAGRTDPLCPVFGRCGGCTWQHLDYEAQLEAKRTILRDALERIAKVPLPAVVPLHPSPSPYGYRTRARVIARRGVVGFRRRASHAVCATRRCPVLVPALDDALLALAEAPPSPTGEWELSAGDGGATACAPVPARDSGSHVVIRSAGQQLRVSAGSFVQANAALREDLVGAVVAAAGAGHALLELHAGVGFFTLPLARSFERVLAVESNPFAVADLEENLAGARIGHVEIVAEPAERVLEDWRFPAFAPEVIVLDPPRAGLDPDLRERLTPLGARRIVYVSCDAATLARDVGAFVDRGWQLRALEAFDLFPQTPHVEAVATLTPG